MTWEDLSKEPILGQDWDAMMCVKRLSTQQLQGLCDVLMKWTGDQQKGQRWEQPRWGSGQAHWDGAEEDAN